MASWLRDISRASGSINHRLLSSTWPSVVTQAKNINMPSPPPRLQQDHAPRYGSWQHYGSKTSTWPQVGGSIGYLHLQIPQGHHGPCAFSLPHAMVAQTIMDICITFSGKRNHTGHIHCNRTRDPDMAPGSSTAQEHQHDSALLHCVITIHILHPSHLPLQIQFSHWHWKLKCLTQHIFLQTQFYMQILISIHK